MEQKTKKKKLMTINKALHSIDAVDRLYQSRGGSRPTCHQDSVDVSIQRLEDYIKRRGGRLITATRNNTNNTSINKTKINRK